MPNFEIASLLPRLPTNIIPELCRTENLFQSLEQRSLTVEEQAVIDARVALQRKLFEEYEKRERRRKIAEVLEVCPDITEEEAEKALVFCSNNEEEAAAQLVSDPDFKRRVQLALAQDNEPEPSISGELSGPAMSKRKQNWHAKPNGPRPRLIDPATLGDKVFVGAFRGKGFERPRSAPGHVKPVRKIKTVEQHEEYTEQEEEEGEEDNELLVQEEEAAEVDAVTDKRHSRISNQSLPKKIDAAISEGSVDPEANRRPPSSKAVVESSVKTHTPAKAHTRHTEPQPTPNTIPKTYALARETSEGELLPVTDSEAKAVRREAGLPSESEGIEEVPRRRQNSRRSTRPKEGDMEGVPVAMLPAMAAKLDGLDDARAVEWLKTMQPHVVAAALERLGNEQPERAVLLRLMLDEDGVCPGGSQSVGHLAPHDDDDHDDDHEAPKSNGRRSGRRLSAPMKYVATLGWDEDEEEVDIDSGDDDFAPKKKVKKTAAAQSKSSSRAKESMPVIEKDNDEGEDSEATEDVLPRRSPRMKRPTPAATETMSDAYVPARTGGSGLPPSGRIAKARAISTTGHTNRGRVKQKSHKSADLVEVGTLRAQSGWYNAGYIFPEGFQSRTLFRSSVALDQLCVHECHIVGRGGLYWPAPTFKVVALDRPEDPLVAKSCTGCWTGILKRINAEIEARRKQGEDLPPPPKTAIAGPEYFGLNQYNIVDEIEALDPDHMCTEYWAGKEDRQKIAAGLPVATTAPRTARGPRLPRAPGAGGRRRKRGNDSDSDNELDHNGEEDDETAYMTNKWSAVNRSERYKKRLEDQGEDASGVDEDNPLPNLIDPITLEPVVRPAISPYGHVMGMATWRAVLAGGGVCPFTKQPLNAEQCKILSKSNIDAYRDRIIR